MVILYSILINKINQKNIIIIEDRTMKKLLLLLLGFTTFLFSNQVTYAQENTSTPSVEINGVKEFLYKEFTDPDKAIADIAVKYSDIFENIKQKYQLNEPISTTNWENYRKKFIQEYGAMSSNKNVNEILKFFDIFENKYQNNEIKKKLLVNDYSNLEYLLPRNSNYVTQRLGKSIDLDKLDQTQLKKQKEFKISSRATFLPDMNRAIDYAVRFAETPNHHYRDYSHSGGNCANFVSQILRSGGLHFDYYMEKNKGWWYNSFTQSISWTHADTFVRYMGLSRTTKSHWTFSSQVVADTIIAIDWDSDGNWDHVAFVVQDENFEADYHGKRYFDYKVAQHSPNYLAWASETHNDWENVEDGWNEYGIVRE